jgi:hypothetical protein
MDMALLLLEVVVSLSVGIVGCARMSTSSPVE